jgi:hypothetical protein
MHSVDPLLNSGVGGGVAPIVFGEKREAEQREVNAELMLKQDHIRCHAFTGGILVRVPEKKLSRVQIVG